MTLSNYRELRVWQQGIELAKKVYAFTTGFPATERYGLTAQMRRAAVSIPSNIAEGYARTGTGEYLRFLSISSGSVAELETQVILSKEFAFLDQNQSADLLNHLDLVGKMLQGLQRSLEPYRVRDISTEYNADPAPSMDPNPIFVEPNHPDRDSSMTLQSAEIRCPKCKIITQKKEQ
jgi:four helix bundle protein